MWEPQGNATHGQVQFKVNCDTPTQRSFARLETHLFLYKACNRRSSAERLATHLFLKKALPPWNARLHTRPSPSLGSFTGWPWTSLSPGPTCALRVASSDALTLTPKRPRSCGGLGTTSSPDASACQCHPRDSCRIESAHKQQQQRQPTRQRQEGNGSSREKQQGGMCVWGGIPAPAGRSPPGPQEWYPRPAK